MKQIYLLESDTQNHSFFIESESYKEGNSGNSIKWLWHNPEKYKPTHFKLRPSENNNKNYKFDISTPTSPFIIISEKAFSVLYDILEPRGLLFDIITESKRKKFLGYYPTNVVSYGSLDLDLSDYRDYSRDSFYPAGKIVRTAVLKESNIDKDYIFMIAESPMKIFVDDKFKKRVEEAGLNGFDFSYNVQLS